jgi:hypothetical protein
MSLDACHHLGRKLDDHNTCALLCAQFPECLPLSPIDEALAAVAKAFATPTERQQFEHGSNVDRFTLEDSAALKVRRQTR